MSRSRTALTAAVALALPLAVCVPMLLPTAASAGVAVSEVYPVPAGGTYAIEGRGWGHGRGMSQYGSLGAASKAGKTADQITAFYYPGTAKGSIGNPALRVKLTDNDSSTEVYAPTSGTALTVTDVASGRKATLPVSSAITRWRSRTASDGLLHLEQLVTGSWKTFANSSWPAGLAGPLQFSGPSSIRVVLPSQAVPGVGSRAYRGAIVSRRVSATQIMSVNVLSMQHYLYGVVPRESPAGWHMEALKAQSIAARSYTQYKRQHIASGQTWDICDTTACQVYGGYATYKTDGTRAYGEEPSTTKAVQATVGVVRTYAGKAIFAEFSSSNGGWSTAHPDPSRFPYLRAQADSWDGLTGSSVHYWKAGVSAVQLQKRFPAIGTLTSLKVTSRDGNGAWKGRVQTVVLTGKDSAGRATSVTTTGREVYLANVWPASANGLRSNWWNVVPATFKGTLVSKAGTISVARSGSAATYFDVKNTGNVPWPVNARLRSSTLAASSSRHDSWISANRPGPVTANLTRRGATDVRPGEVARFGFRIAGNGRPPQSTSEGFGLAWDGWQRLSGFAVSLSYRIT